MDTMKNCKYVFVILTYRSSSDLEECLLSIKENFSDYKVVIVNSFYDFETQKSIFSIGEKYDCECLSVENRGYSYGNNIGIEFCKEKYQFDYLIVCNPDIVVNRNNFDSLLYQEEKIVIAPIIKNAKGKNQNPYWVVDNKLCEYLIYMGYKKKSTLILYGAFAINKIIRCIFNILFGLSSKRKRCVYACHGSFVIYSAKVLSDICPLYDDNMFLFAEEAYTARVLKQNKIPIVYTKDITVLHKEDGSMNVAKINEASESRKSVLYYYEKLRK